MATAQRGRPQRLALSMRANPGLFHALGVFTHFAEHIGDLTNRMGDWCEFTDFGFEMVNEKVSRALRYYREDPGLEEQVDTNLRSNYAIFCENPEASLTFEAYRAAFVGAAAAYADAHAKLPVYNEAQWLGRECAIALGRLEFDRVGQLLGALEDHLQPGRAAWVQFASQVEISPDGEAALYQGPDHSQLAAPELGCPF